MGRFLTHTHTHMYITFAQPHTQTFTARQEYIMYNVPNISLHTSVRALGGGHNRFTRTRSPRRVCHVRDGKRFH